MKRLAVVLAVLLAMLPAASCADGTGPSRRDLDYEVWVLDQANSPALAYGGTLHIYDRARVIAAAPATGAATEVVDLGQTVSAACLSATGANPVRPHYLAFNAARTHAVISFVASGHVAILAAATRAPVGCVRTSAGAAGARQAHAAAVTADDRYILVANQNGKLLERIDANFATNSYALNPAAALDLAACTTPSGAACQSATARPDNAPIVVLPTTTASVAVVTLRGGGLFAVDPTRTPMAIRAEYDATAVRGSGLDAVQAGSNVVVTSGTGFAAYRIALAGLAGSGPTPPNQPAASLLFADPAAARDAHGAAATPDGRYVWVADRGANGAEVFDASSGARTTVSLASPASADPAPDLLDMSPNGDLAFVTLRGPNPLTGGAIATGAAPGLAVVRLERGGQGGTVAGVIPISRPDAGGAERADPHAVRVRRKG